MRSILHCDANNFYASVEMIQNPALKGKPVIVGGVEETRHGIVLTASTEAKKRGVRTAQTLWQAKKLCPEAIVVRPHHNLYKEYSHRLFSIYREYTDLVEPFGIDEGWLDVTHSTKLFGSPETIAETIRARTKAELGLSVSIGVSFTKPFAKLGSDLKKPDAVTVISPENFREVIWPLPVESLLMVGKTTKALLNGLAVYTVGDLAAVDPAILEKRLGINAKKLIDCAGGIGEDLLDTHEMPESVGNSITMPYDVSDYEKATAVITSLCEKVSMRLRSLSMKAGGVTLTLKDNRFQSFSRRTHLPAPSANAADFAKTATNLLQSHYDFSKKPPLRLLGVSAYDLYSEDEGYQLSMFEEDKKTDLMESAVYRLREKYGRGVIQRGNTIKHSDLCEHIDQLKE